MLMEKTGAVAIAVDTLSLDFGMSGDFATHFKWLPNGRYGIECLRGLDELPATGAKVSVGAPRDSRRLRRAGARHRDDLIATASPADQRVGAGRGKGDLSTRFVRADALPYAEEFLACADQRSGALMRSTWDRLQALMAPGALDPSVEGLIYVAVSTANGCDYCVHSRTAAAKAKGTTADRHAELLPVIAMAAQTNALATALQVPVDAAFEADGGQKEWVTRPLPARPRRSRLRQQEGTVFSLRTPVMADNLGATMNETV